MPRHTSAVVSTDWWDASGHYNYGVVQKLGQDTGSSPVGTAIPTWQGGVSGRGVNPPQIKVFTGEQQKPAQAEKEIGNGAQEPRVQSKLKCCDVITRLPRREYFDMLLQLSWQSTRLVSERSAVQVCSEAPNFFSRIQQI